MIMVRGRQEQPAAQRGN